MMLNSAIRLAREGLDEGYRVIAGELNRVLAEKSPNVSLQADPPNSGDSLRSAAGKIRRALPEMRLRSLDVAESNRDVRPWSLGIVEINVDCGIDSFCGFELTETLDRLRKQDRTVEQWGMLVRHIEDHHRKTLAALNDDGRNRPPALVLAPDISGFCSIYGYDSENSARCR